MNSQYGWIGNILTIDLSSRSFGELPTDAYHGRYIGGLGIAERIYWDQTSPSTDAFHPENPLIFMTGPLTGTTAPAAPRMVVCGKSPCTYPERFVHASIAGFFPTELKRAGFDGIVITGKADKPVLLRIADGKASLQDAADMWGLNNTATRAALEQRLGRNVKILSIGSACERLTRIGIVAGDAGGSASMGFGSLMGSKNLKAIAIRGSGTIPVARPDAVKEIRKKLSAMTGPGFFNLYAQTVPMPGTETIRRIHCHACPQGCWRSLQRRPSGHEGIRKCHMGTFYAKWDIKLNGSISDITFLAADMAHDYGFCTDEIMFLLLWLERCVDRGILSEKEVGLPFGRMGSIEFIQQFFEKIVRREGFGAVLAEGCIRAATRYGMDSQKIAHDFLTVSGRPSRTYGPKSFPMSVPVFAVEQRPAITTLHEICQPLAKWALWLKSNGRDSYVSTDVLRGIAERFWGGAEAVDFSTVAGKARAAKIIQDRNYAKECIVLCDLVWPVMDDASTPDHIGDPDLEAKLFSAVTGISLTGEEFLDIGERIFNLNRAIQLRDGRHGRQDDALSESYFTAREEPPSDIFDIYNPERLLPGKGDELISFKMKALDRRQVNEMMDEYYRLRGWDAQTGFLLKKTEKDLFG